MTDRSGHFCCFVCPIFFACSVDWQKLDWNYFMLFRSPSQVFVLSSSICIAKLSLQLPSAEYLLSSLFGCSSSRIGNTSSHLHYMMFETIQTIYFLWGYDPGNMSVSTYAELSPVYCCLVTHKKLKYKCLWPMWDYVESFVPVIHLCQMFG